MCNKRVKRDNKKYYFLYHKIGRLFLYELGFVNISRP